MPTTHRAFSRALSTAAAAAVISLTTAGVASAHVHVDADDAAPGSTSVLTFRVPGESETGSLTTGFTVTLPNVPSARTEVVPGWTARLDRDVAAGTVRSVTWTAAPATGISADQFALFRISVTLPDQPSVTLPAIQTYSDGEVVRWDQAPLPDGAEPEYPAPVLDLSAGGGAGASEHNDTTPAPAAQTPVAAPPPAAAADDTARWLAGGALVLASVGVVAAFAGRRRS